jgi:hypothetical protein
MMTRHTLLQMLVAKKFQLVILLVRPIVSFKLIFHENYDIFSELLIFSHATFRFRQRV